MPQAQPRQRLVLLGASNLVKAFATVVEVSRQIFGGPLEILAATGHGRSYGIANTFAGLTLPGIAECGLWDELAQRPAMPTAALLTDVGNDLMYEVPPAQIAGWMQQCLDRLAPQAEHLVMTQLPVAGIESLAAWRYYLFRTLFFPRNRMPLSMAIERALELSGRVQQLSASCGAKLVELRAQWYGVDPIHIRRRHWKSAWGEILSAWDPANRRIEVSDVAPLRVCLHCSSPQQSRLLGWHRSRQQPMRTLSDGSTLSLY